MLVITDHAAELERMLLRWIFQEGGREPGPGFLIYDGMPHGIQAYEPMPADF